MSDTPNIDALRKVVDRCDWCCRRKDLQAHHVAQGFRYKLLDDVRFVLMICSDCHDCLHGMNGEHGRACGLALLRIAGRGTVQEFWTATDRKWPRAEYVKHWTKRLLRGAK